MQSISKLVLPLLLIACLGLTGCYQAKVTTNRSDGGKVVKKKWAPSFIYGLVPAKIDVSNQCPNGIASAERKFNFGNMLVSQITFGIFLPQTVKVTCASGGAMSDAAPAQNPKFTLSKNASRQTIQSTLSTATMEAMLNQRPVEVEVATN